MACIFNPQINKNSRFPAFYPEFSQEGRRVCAPDPTPLYHLPQLARLLELEALLIKDESRRGGLKSFKSLGVRWAVHKLSGQSQKKTVALAAATDGNHGLGVARVAHENGLKAVIWMPAGAARARVKKIKSLGASCVVTANNYDETLSQMLAEAALRGWTVIQDTAWPGYEEIPLWIMQGYSLIAREIIAEWPSAKGPPTHIFLQAGVGSFAAAMAATLVTAFPEATFILVEPRNANCFYISLSSGREEQVTGSLATIMAGLSCGRPSPLAWPVLRDLCAAAITCEDWQAACAMRLLWSPAGDDPAIEAGESGAAPLGALLWLMCSEDATQDRAKLGLGPRSRVLMVNTEGATDPENFCRIIWGGAWPAPPEFCMPGAGPLCG